MPIYKPICSSSTNNFVATDANTFATLCSVKHFHERLEYALKLRGVSQSELARRVGVRAQAIQYLASKGKASTHAGAIASALRVSPTWLTHGRGPMTSGPHLVSDETTEYREPSPNSSIALASERERLNANTRSARPAGRSYPIINFASAGQWEEVIDSYEPGDADGYYPAPPNVRCSTSSYWTEVEGRSMVSQSGGPSYPPGTLIFVDPEVRDLITGALVLARLAETHEVTFKRLSIEGSTFFLEPLNTQYPIIRIDSESQIIGTIKGAMLAI